MDNQSIWLIDEAGDSHTELEAAVEEQALLVTRDARRPPPIAIRFNELIIHKNKKWFGEADIRVDAMVVHGGQTGEQAEGAYSPGTFRFARIADGQQLPVDNLMIFRGQPAHFLDMFITVSRDRKDSDDLASLLHDALRSDEFDEACGTLLALAVAAPSVAVVTSAIGAAAVLGKVAYDVLQKATGATIGLYRASWLEHRDRFGLGQHPPTGQRRINDLSFRFEVVTDTPVDL